MGSILSVPLNSYRRIAGRYVLAARLSGHTDAITCVSLSKDGSILASGGYDGIRLWDMKSYKEVSAPPQRMYNDAISAVAWMIPDDAYLTFCYASSLGMLVFCREGAGQHRRFEEVLARRLGSGTAITCVATGPSDRAAMRLATASRDGLVQAWVFTLPNRLENTFSLNFTNTIPIGLAFADNTRGDLLFFDLVAGRMHILNGRTGDVTSSKQLGGIIGHVAVNSRPAVMVIDSVSNGFALHEADTGKFLYNFPTPARARTLPRQVTFGEGGRVVVGGSDNGTVSIYDRRTASLLQTFKPTKGLVQTVHTHFAHETSTIIAASTALKSNNTIWVWTRRGGRAKKGNWRATIQKILKWAIQLLIMLAALGFMAQNTSSLNYVTTTADRMMENVRAWDYPSPPQTIANYAQAARYVIDDHIANFNIPPPKPFDANPAKPQAAKRPKDGKVTVVEGGKGARKANRNGKVKNGGGKGKSGSKGLAIWAADVEDAIGYEEDDPR
ncbi:WD40-repeat-containing domain protein [Irpex lacteus]|nr:WD40-repeat-containing domain protein [Irpex lacteus]